MVMPQSVVSLRCNSVTWDHAGSDVGSRIGLADPDRDLKQASRSSRSNTAHFKFDAAVIRSTYERQGAAARCILRACKHGTSMFDQVMDDALLNAKASCAGHSRAVRSEGTSWKWLSVFKLRSKRYSSETKPRKVTNW